MKRDGDLPQHSEDYLTMALWLIVVSSIVQYASEEHPLMVLGLPGLVALILGLVYGGLLLSIYANTHEFIFAYALLAVGGSLAGLFLILVAIVLYSIANVLRRAGRPDATEA